MNGGTNHLKLTRSNTNRSVYHKKTEIRQFANVFLKCKNFIYNEIIKKKKIYPSFHLLVLPKLFHRGIKTLQLSRLV